MSGLILCLSTSQSHVFLLNSRLGLFTAASPPKRRRHPFSRSYRVILPSSLAMNHSSTLGYSPRLPVSVYGTGCIYLKLRGFSWKYDYGHYHLVFADSVYYRSSAQVADLPTTLITYMLQRTIPSVRRPFTPSSPHRSIYRYWNINQFAIGFAFRLYLRTRLTLI